MNSYYNQGLCQYLSKIIMGCDWVPITTNQ